MNEHSTDSTEASSRQCLGFSSDSEASATSRCFWSKKSCLAMTEPLNAHVELCSEELATTEVNVLPPVPKFPPPQQEWMECKAGGSHLDIEGEFDGKGYTGHHRHSISINIILKL